MMKLPPFGDGQKIGLFGGSFNPAHLGHRAVALYALKRLRLDWVWWLVSPQNPLKDAGETGEYGRRFASTQRIARHPRFIVTDIEKQLGSPTTSFTLDQLRPALARAHFIWIMGADSFADLHRWHDWLDIPAALPLAILARPGYSIRALNSRAAIRFARQRGSLWTFIHMPLRPESSTAIRQRRAPLAGNRRKA
jgi:nicotinate-nucleotide adenylyltransferase